MRAERCTTAKMEMSYGEESWRALRLTLARQCKTPRGAAKRLRNKIAFCKTILPEQAGHRNSALQFAAGQNLEPTGHLRVAAFTSVLSGCFALIILDVGLCAAGKKQLRQVAPI